jgi:pimeloyl-ACP methyl ester carboxylesterase
MRGLLSALLLVFLPLLLGFSDCGFFEAPEESEVLRSDPEAVERLRQNHAEAIGYLEGENGGPIPDGSATAGHLKRLPAALRDVRSYSGGRLVFSTRPGSMGCPSDGVVADECLVIELQLKLKRGGRMPHTVWFTAWEVEAEAGGAAAEADAGQAATGSSVGDCPQWGHASATTADGRTIELTPEARQILSDATCSAMERVTVYSDAAVEEQRRILGSLLGCAPGSVYEQSLMEDEGVRSHWCETGGARDGVYVSGKLSELLVGVRGTQGQYQLGEKHGEWVFRDTAGAVVRRETWDAGKRVEAAPAASVATTQDIVLPGPGYTLPASLETAAEAAPTPCVIFFAGSGPTDRNWTSPMLPGSNGSAQQLAEALRERGIGSLRFDKVGSGTNMEGLEALSLDHYRDEGVLAYRYMSQREVCGPIFLVGNSEGSLHAMRVGELLQSEADFGGVVSLAGPSRRIIDHLVEQITEQAGALDRDVEAVKQLMARYVAALEGLPDPPEPPLDFAAFPEIEALWLQALDPVQGRVVRELMLADPLASIRQYRAPALVVSARNDIQVPVLDGDRIFAALPKADALRQRTTIEGANHVFKAETGTPDDTSMQELASAYVQDGRELAPGIVDALVAFIEAVGP